MVPAVETCCVCTEPFDSEQRLATIGECNHTDACSLCYLRLRVLLNDLECVVCRGRLDNIYVWRGSLSERKNWDNDIRPNIWGKDAGPNYVHDERSMMFMPRDYAEGFVANLERAVCQTCGVLFSTLKQLQDHLKNVHEGKQHCYVCLKEKKVFLMEQRQYEKDELKAHMSNGDKHGFKGHPYCKFCNARMYDNVQLYEHLTKDHFKCHLCEGYKYFKNYKDLEQHFRVSHFLCEHQNCLSLKFQVFATDIDLTAHIVNEHPGMKPPRINHNFIIGRVGEERKEMNDMDSSNNSGGEMHEWSPENLGAAERDFRRRNSSVVDEGDFPLLSNEPARNMASWVRSGQTLPHTSDEMYCNEEFPALTVPNSARKISTILQSSPVAAASQSSNSSSRTFLNALSPYPTPAMVAAADTDQWTYAMPPPDSNMEINFGNLKVKRSNKNRKDRMMAAKTSPDGVKPSPVEKVEPPRPIEDVVATMHRLLGDDDFETFRMVSLSFREGDINALDFYQKAKEVLPEDQFLGLFMPLVQSLPDSDKVKELEVVIATEESLKGQERGPQNLQHQQKQQPHSPKLQSDDATASTGSSRRAIAPDSVFVNSSNNNHADIPVPPQASSGFHNEEEKCIPTAQPQKFKQKCKGGGNSASTWITAMKYSGNLSQKGKTGLSIVKAKDNKSRKAANAKLSVQP